MERNCLVIFSPCFFRVEGVAGYAQCISARAKHPVLGYASDVIQDRMNVVTPTHVLFI